MSSDHVCTMKSIRDTRLARELGVDDLPWLKVCHCGNGDPATIKWFELYPGGSWVAGFTFTGLSVLPMTYDPGLGWDWRCPMEWALVDAAAYSGLSLSERKVLLDRIWNEVVAPIKADPVLTRTIDPRLIYSEANRRWHDHLQELKRAFSPQALSL